MTAPQRFAHSVARFGLAAVVTFLAANAPASEQYPREIQRALDTPCPPDCTTCHTRRSGGTLTANTPVGISMRRAGLEGGDTSLLFDALATLETEATDSDMDGTPDVAEMRAGTDPNAPEGGLKCWEPPEQGCSLARRSPGERQSAAEAFGAWLALAALARRGRPLRKARR